MPNDQIILFIFDLELLELFQEQKKHTTYFTRPVTFEYKSLKRYIKFWKTLDFHFGTVNNIPVLSEK